jgi:hypothetical protein
MTKRRERLRRWVRSVPVPLLTGAALLVGRPWGIGFALAWGLADVVLRRLHEKALDARLTALAGSLARGVEPEVTARGLEALVADAASMPGYHSVAVLYLGVARARAGDIDGALELLHVVYDSGWLEGRDAWQAWLLPTLCQLHAARGELDVAERWLETARGRLPVERHAALAGSEIVLAIRRGRHQDAIARIDAAVDARREGDKSGDPARTHLAMLRAFACDRAGRPLSSSEVESVVAASRAAGNTRIPLEKWWAELAAFVDRHSPAAAPGPSVSPSQPP